MIKSLCVFLLATSLTAGVEQGYQQGLSFNAAIPFPSESTLLDLPGYKGPDVGIDESTLYAQAKDAFQGDMKELLVSSSIQTEESKIEHDIAPDRGLLKQAGEITKDPLKFLGGGEVTTTTTVLENSEVEKTCEEGVPFELKTRLTLNYTVPPRQNSEVVLVLNYPNYLRKVGFSNDEIDYLYKHPGNHQINIERFKKYVCPHFNPVDALTGQRCKIDCYRIKNFRALPITNHHIETVVDPYGVKRTALRYAKIAYQHDTYEGTEDITEQGWAFETPDLSENLSRYNCTLVSEKCVDDRPRQIDELTLKRPCWEKELTYTCGIECNTCGDLIQRGCVLKSSSCKDTFKDSCAIFSKTYTCKQTTRVLQNSTTNKDLPFCLAGDCHKLELTQHQDFHEAVSKLSILRDAQKQMDAEGLTVFKGTQDTCTRDFASFRDCCGSCKGWGTSIGFSGCSAEEKTLSERREKGLCRYIGTYCSQRFLGICLTQKSVFCCFPSKLARIFQEKGRAQLGKGWGDPESPACGPLTIEEIQRIDWNKVDLSELFSDLFAHTSSKTKLEGSFKMNVPDIQLKSKKEGLNEAA